MHTFKVLKALNKDAAATQGFNVLNKDLTNYIPGELDLVELGSCFGGVNKQYIALHHLSLHPAVGLKRMGCENVDELLQASRYACGFLGNGETPHYALVPLGIVVNKGVPGLKKYGEAVDKFAKNGVCADSLHLLPDGSRFSPEVLQNSFSDDGELHYHVNRFEQMYLGSGFTREMLAARETSAVLRAVGVNLSNGDTLLAYAYKVHRMAGEEA